MKLHPRCYCSYREFKEDVRACVPASVKWKESLFRDLWESYLTGTQYFAGKSRKTFVCIAYRFRLSVSWNGFQLRKKYATLANDVISLPQKRSDYRITESHMPYERPEAAAERAVERVLGLTGSRILFSGKEPTLERVQLSKTHPRLRMRFVTTDLGLLLSPRVREPRLQEDIRSEATEHYVWELPTQTKKQLKKHA